MNDPKPLVVANLKAHKTWDEMSTWLDQVVPQASGFGGTLIVCPSAPFLAAASERINSLGWQIRLGSQDVSKFDQGAYTGEFAASQIANLCQYSIIGHSERRQNFGESEQILAQKVSLALVADIEPIYCIQQPKDQIPAGVTIVAYEPVFAIGTGNADTPENVHKVANELKRKGNLTIIYGGSVSERNVKSFFAGGVVDGVLIGASNSLDPQKFNQTISALS